jgi:mycofactocin precursor
MPSNQNEATQTEPVEDVVEETLVEEVSIDGMCGVY